MMFAFLSSAYLCQEKKRIIFLLALSQKLEQFIFLCPPVMWTINITG